ncbi:glutamine--fructose-6-phosphate transaminase (isomerizing) [Nocardioides lianchengensis]|uniref:Glutamine--fructose-6-phosphate aminotransferase [isomerizing] n=1 Tax=Nocardioides lianchengensis TaxID=1045774 RepID=A0A1G6L9L5_9ACTN|nr:glutamine--fructose-6-phosphate transaminase (isomerizing) [Nocardioides lianchengensis]NYG12639.1 glucosamine--fructose-6-phosphate aminotransferase (isomerizing) [Nocardioides lianchengensis]SDC39737.1 glucosamine--fructose-6-phosphate aminotransferase (isomerizing) [Nocardioides lianchengensis]
MCGIVGYIGTQQAAPLLLEGLTRLEHRGYDSAGVAVLGASGSALKVAKKAGRVRDLAEDLPKRFAGKVGIGHTRWATHGPATDANAHPHTDTKGDVAVVHNGIIDNASALRKLLADDGVDLVSDTDTEVLAHLVARSDADTLEGRVADALAVIEGTYGVAVVHADFPDRIVVARNGSPLIIGVGDKEMHVASDLAALVRYTTTVAHLDDGEMATLTATGFTTYRQDLTATATLARTVDIDPSAYDASDAVHAAGGSFMHREIHEQPQSTERALRGRLDERFGTAHLGGLNMDPRETRAIRRVKILGCGSAYYVGQMGASLVEELARIPADAEAASEFRYRNPIIEPDTLYVAVSQSGETIDTLLAVQEIRRKGGRVIGLVNVVGSAIARECDGGIYLHAGPEVAVASTKALTNMFVGFALLALQLGRVRDLSIADGKRLIAGLNRLPGQIAEILEQEEELAAAAARLAEADSLFFIGRVRGFPVAREGAQKFKEISYRHAEAYQTSELKHGPLALIDEALPTVAVVPSDELTDRNVGALHEIAARRGPLVVVTHEDVDLGELDAVRIAVPRNERELDPILLTVPLQLLAYHAALHLGLDIDKPRNLAKSVTVE